MPITPSSKEPKVPVGIGKYFFFLSYAAHLHFTNKR